MLSSVQGLAPVCAPVLGGILLGAMDWKGIFWILLAIGILLIVALSAFKESLEIKKRQKGMSFLHSNIICRYSVTGNSCAMS